MKIASIEALPLHMQLKEPFVIGNATNYDMLPVIARVKTDAGITGYGEAMPAWEVTGETPASCTEIIREFDLGRLSGCSLRGMSLDSIEDVQRASQFMTSDSTPVRIAGNSAAKAAIEGALWDALGKYKQKPVWDLLGGTMRTISFNHVIGIFPPEETARRAYEQLQAGATTIKLKVGIPVVGSHENFERDVIAVRKVHELCSGRSARVIVDANQGYGTADKAIEVCEKYSDCVEYIEQPVLAGDKTGLARVRQELGVPIMADEAVHDIHDARTLLNMKAVDLFNLKIMKTGGLSSLLEIATLAEQHGVPCQIGSMLENSLGTALGVHAFFTHTNIISTELGAIRRYAHILGKGLSVGNQTLQLDTKPGLGVSVSEEELAQYGI